ncbi:hypothetical protein CAOG_02636 [Capsaspora owczarzaki ATCC 30864]|uniref:Anaphase-promoting complex subunit 5 n=1 Tax=Capsaspora owczarzaki (strain ATCC 30864) TaxID=595528 RepID=A0A0D2VMT4_CAPO3|nr:hypothetical protein CAOG_02636 [Capsaspora owczarzaki ATCC 30864]KJE91507.1 hypothetical protein CAOG_002636 [Capsaspora owczarzaki ATCC 30864]|eukprot:XP_004349386.1 hypothetical protein CAOG_02636 [Capsaspora owczarzaki ATCC 30864]
MSALPLTLNGPKVRASTDPHPSTTTAADLCINVALLSILAWYFDNPDAEDSILPLGIHVHQLRDDSADIALSMGGVDCRAWFTLGEPLFRLDDEIQRLALPDTPLPTFLKTQAIPQSRIRACYELVNQYAHLPDQLPLSRLLSCLSDDPEIYPTVLLRLFTILQSEVHFLEFFTTLQQQLYRQDGPSFLPPSSILGVFVRLHLHIISVLPFESATPLLEETQAYVEQWRDEVVRDGGIRSFQLDSAQSPQTGKLQVAGLQHAQLLVKAEMDAIMSGHRDVASVHERANTILKCVPLAASALYLLFLNNLRVGEYAGAMDFAHNYFDSRGSEDVFRSWYLGRNATPTESASTKSFACMTKAAIHYTFGHFAKARASIAEAIRLAQQLKAEGALLDLLAWSVRLHEAMASESAVRDSTMPLITRWIDRADAAGSVASACQARIAGAQHVLFSGQPLGESVEARFGAAMYRSNATKVDKSSIAGGTQQEQLQQLQAALAAAEAKMNSAPEHREAYTQALEVLTYARKSQQAVGASAANTRQAIALAQSAHSLTYRESSTILDAPALTMQFQAATWRLLGNSALADTFDQMLLSQSRHSPAVSSVAGVAASSSSRTVPLADALDAACHLALSHVLRTADRAGALQLLTHVHSSYSDTTLHEPTQLIRASNLIQETMLMTKARSAGDVWSASVALERIHGLESTRASTRATDSEQRRRGLLMEAGQWAYARRAVVSAHNSQASTRATLTLPKFYHPSKRWDDFNAVLTQFQQQANTSVTSVPTLSLTEPNHVRDIRVWMDRAHVCLAAGNTWQAIEELARALELCDKHHVPSIHADALFLLARCLLRTDAPSAALYHVQRCLPWVLQNGTMEQRAHAQFIMAKCRVQLALSACVPLEALALPLNEDAPAFKIDLTETGRRALLDVLPLLTEALAAFRLAGTLSDVAAVLHLRALVYDFVGDKASRDRDAASFNQRVHMTQVSV